MKLSPKVNKSLNRVIEKFQSGDLSSVSKIARIQMDPKAPSIKWTVSNRVIAFLQSGEFDCRGYRQWLDVGRQVNKGSKAIYIISPITVKSKEDKVDCEDKYTCIGFNAIPVFPASATNGEKDLVSYEPRKLPPLIDIADKLNISVAYIPISSDRLGDCRTDGSKIRLGSHDPAIFFHELSHAIHAKISGKLSSGQQEDQETIADFTSAVLMDLYGFGDNSGNAWKYISRYAKDPLIAITKAMGTVEKILSILFEDNLDKGEIL